MSTLKVEICKIEEIESHPNADRLEIAKVKGWQCVVQKGAFQKGDICVYLPIDSILPAKVEEFLFPPDSKVKLQRSRIKTIKLRGAISQGMVVKPEEIGIEKPKLGKDVTAFLGITKYEPSQRPSFQPNHSRSKKQTNPHFNKYTSIENFKNYPQLFKLGELVEVTEKIHGTNFRCGWVPFHADTLWKKIKKLFGKSPKFEFVYGSHNVQLQNKILYTGAYSAEQGNVYWETVKKYNLMNLLHHGEVIYGEIYGDGIQKGYSYGCGPNERKFIVFDVQIDGKFISRIPRQAFCHNKGLPTVPLVYLGAFDFELIKNLCKGNSILSSAQSVIEGLVIRPVIEEMSYMGRKILKLINDDYLLLKDNTEFH